MKIKDTYESPLGTMIMVAENDKLLSLCMEKDFDIIGIKPGKSDVFELCRSQLDEYFAGKRTEFSVPIELRGTAFQMKVWNSLSKIPYGETRTYRDIAEDIGAPKSYRAVGSANNSNPLLVILPCHRVVGINGNLTGYSAGLEMKEYLLEMESKFSKNK